MFRKIFVIGLLFLLPLTSTASSPAVSAAPDPAFRALLAEFCKYDMDIDEKDATVCAEAFVGAALRANIERKAPRYNMTDDELVALWGYTETHFMHINGSLKKGGEARKTVAPYVEKIKSALKKLPDHGGYVFRGASPRPETLQRHFEGAVVVYPAFLSASSERTIANPDFNCAPYRFELLSKHGKLIRNYSSKPHEEEVLFTPGTKFKVIGAGEPEYHGEEGEECPAPAPKFIMVELE